MALSAPLPGSRFRLRFAGAAPEESSAVAPGRRRGRAAASNLSGRFEKLQRAEIDDGWGSLDDLPPFRTQITHEKPKTIITRNDSPDIAFERSINPYRGCEHGCVYCFARPTHAFLGLSPGLDFESRLFVKDDAAQMLKRELSAAELPAQGHRDRNQHRSLPADRTRAPRHARNSRGSGAGQPSRSRSSPNPRWSCAISISSRPMADAAGQGGAVGDDARPRSGAGDGAARGDAGAPAGGDREAVAGRRSDRGHDRSGHPRRDGP